MVSKSTKRLVTFRSSVSSRLPFSTHKNLTSPVRLVLGYDLLAKDNCVQNIGAELKRFHQAWLCSADVDNTFRVGGNANFDAGLVSDGSVQVNDTLTVTGLGTFENNVIFEGTQTTTGLATFDYNVGIGGTLTVAGPTSLGSSCADTLDVNATSTFECPATFKDTVLFEKQVTFSQQPVFPGAGLVDTLLTGDTVIGNACASNTLTIESATTVKCDILPGSDSAINLGSATARFANVYTGDLHLKNDRGDWTMVEEDEFLTLRNNKTGKTFRLLMEEV